MKRYGTVVGIKQSEVAKYKELHAAVWPGVLKMISECHIRNYSIYLRRLAEGNYYLFSYFEYHGEDFAADSAKMAADPVTRDWWDVCIPLLEPLPDRQEGECWSGMEEVFHYD